MSVRLLIIGAGGHGKAVAEAAILCGEFDLIGFLDDNASQVWSFPVLGAVNRIGEFRNVADAAVVAIGNNNLRKQFQEKLIDAGFNIATIVHPRSIVSPRAVLGAGCAIMAGAVVGTEAHVGRGAIVNSGAVVDHHCVVEEFAHLGVGALMAGGTQLGARAWMQAGAALGYGTKVPAGAVLPPCSTLKAE